MPQHSISRHSIRTIPWWNFLAVASVVILLALNIGVSLSAIAPRAPWDEIAPLQMAHRLSGLKPNNIMSVPGYYPGWGMLLTPLWWISQDPQTVYRLAIAVVILLAMLTVIPLSRIAMRMGLSPAQSITAAALTLSLPARTVNADYVLAENLLAFLVAMVTLFAFRLWERPTIRRTAEFAMIGTLCYLSHARALIVIVAICIWFLLFIRKNWKITIFGIGFSIIGFFIVKILCNLIMLPIMLGDFDQTNRLLSNEKNLLIGNIIRVAAQQAWAQLAGSFGIISIGFIFLVVLVYQELKKHDIGPHCFSLCLFLGAAALSVFAMVGPSQTGRFDVQVYTRYLDPFAMIIVLYAIVAVIKKVSTPVILAAGILSIADILAVCLWAAPWQFVWGSMDGPANSAAVLAWAKLRPESPFNLPLIPGPTNGNSFWFWGSVAAVSGLIVVFLLRSFKKTTTVVLIIAFSVLSIASNPSQKREYPQTMGTAIEKIEEALNMKQGTLNMDFDISCRKGVQYDADAEFEKALNWSGYWFLPRKISTVNAKQGESFHNDIVISCESWPLSEQYKAKSVKNSEFETYQLWVLPGKTQDKLSSLGLLNE